MFKISALLKWKPYAEQDVCERRLREVMKRLNIEEFNFNWDRSSCYIEFHYQENLYRMEHSVQKAKEKGVIVLRNGLDCLFQLVQSLEDLCCIIERGTYKLESWVAGMKQPSLAEKSPQYQEEVHISYKAAGKLPKYGYSGKEELGPMHKEEKLVDFELESNPLIRR